jgi:hypothetical protein
MDPIVTELNNLTLNNVTTLSSKEEEQKLDQVEIITVETMLEKESIIEVTSIDTKNNTITRSTYTKDTYDFNCVFIIHEYGNQFFHITDKQHTIKVDKIYYRLLNRLLDIIKKSESYKVPNIDLFELNTFQFPFSMIFDDFKNLVNQDKVHQDKVINNSESTTNEDKDKQHNNKTNNGHDDSDNDDDDENDDNEDESTNFTKTELNKLLKVSNANGTINDLNYIRSHFKSDNNRSCEILFEIDFYVDEHDIDRIIEFDICLNCNMNLYDENEKDIQYSIRTLKNIIKNEF